MKLITTLSIFLLMHCSLGAQHNTEKEDKPVINLGLAYRFNVADAQFMHGAMLDLMYHNPKPRKLSFSFVVGFSRFSMREAASMYLGLLNFYSMEIDAQFTIVPLELTGLLGKNGHYFEFGPSMIGLYFNGTAKTTISGNSYEEILKEHEQGMGVYFGYKYQPNTRGLYFRAGMLHIFEVSGSILGVNLGFSL